MHSVSYHCFSILLPFSSAMTNLARVFQDNHILFFLVESIKSSGYSPSYERTADINKYTYIQPNIGMCSNTKLSIHLPGEGALHPLIAVCRQLLPPLPIFELKKQLNY